MSLRDLLDGDPDVAPGSLRTDTDQTLAIGRDVWRLRWRNQHTTAVHADADLHTTCGALLDALALHAADHLTTPSDEVHGIERYEGGGVNLLVARPLPGAQPTETDQALRTMRDSVVGLTARIWYLGDRGQWVEDQAAAPTWPADDRTINGWVNDLLLPRLTTPPSTFATALVDAVDDPSLHLYPAPITAAASDRWALRIDGLEIGTTRGDTATLRVGKPRSRGDGPQRAAFIEVFGHPTVQVATHADPAEGVLSVEEAATQIRRLMRRFRSTDVPGEPLTHRSRAGIPYIDEHTLESRLLKGVVAWDPNTNPVDLLVAGDQQVARGSQFPTQWGTDTEPRFLDALLHDDSTPIAVELKVATSGQGRNYRRALLQAVLYRHLITRAPALDPWFAAAGLDRTQTRAAIGIPIPRRWLPKFERDLQLLREVAALLGASVHVLDDRATPEWTVHESLPEPDRAETELHTWRLAAALSHRWPEALGRVVELHGAGGFYDQIELRHRNDRHLSHPSVGPRVSLNRPGSAWVFAQDGSPRWVWRGIWGYLANGGDVDEAAATIGAVAGLPDEEPATSATFAEVARDFLTAHPGEDWEWRCAWPGFPGIQHWAEPFAGQLTRYRRNSAADQDLLPSLARIWGAASGEVCGLLVDQQTLRRFET